MSDKPLLYIQIEGMDMEFEAWELIRLFFDEDSLKFIRSNEDIIDFAPGSLLSVRVTDDAHSWECNALLFTELHSLEQLRRACHMEIKPDDVSSKKITDEDLKKPGGGLLKRHKILAGSCIVDVLSKITDKRLPYGSLTGVRPVKLAMECLNDGMDRRETINHLIGLTGMSENKAGLLYDVAEAERPYIQSSGHNVHLYIGIPFCASRCLYCSFTSYPVKRYEYLVEDYLKCLQKEFEYTTDHIRKNILNIGSVYIGGGTPTSIDAASLGRLLTNLNACFDLSGVEFTVEAGRPDTITEEKLKAMMDAHVSRISINPQTMNPETLRLIGRNHTPEDVEDKFHMARELGFKNINMDLIAGLPGEDEKMFRHTLERIEKMAPDSLTVHTMAVKRASRLHEEQGSFSVTPDYVVESMIEDARQSAAAMGMRPYYLYRQKNILANLENTGYAKPGLECIYNINTMEECETVLAMGAGAISKFVHPETKKIERACNVKEVTQYIERIDEMLERKSGK